MTAVQIVVIGLLTLMSGAGFVANEVSHGAMSEAMDLGHHHLSDAGGYHCARHDSAAHMQHMHNGTFTDHQHCSGGVQMHGDGHHHNHGGMHGT